MTRASNRAKEWVSSFSDDNGVTWLPGEIALLDAGEPNIAELPDGGVLLTARNGDARSRRVSATSLNGATDWSAPRFIDELYEPGCMAGMVSHPGTSDVGGPLLLFSNVQTTERAHSSRRNLTIHLSRDGGCNLAGQPRTGTRPQCVQRPGGPAGWSSSLLL